MPRSKGQAALRWRRSNAAQAPCLKARSLARFVNQGSGEASAQLFGLIKASPALARGMKGHGHKNRGLAFGDFSIQHLFRPSRRQSCAQPPTEALTAVKLQLQDRGAEASCVDSIAARPIKLVLVQPALGAARGPAKPARLAGTEFGHLVGRHGQTATRASSSHPRLHALPAVPADTWPAGLREFPAAQEAGSRKHDGQEAAGELCEKRQENRSRFGIRWRGKREARRHVPLPLTVYRTTLANRGGLDWDRAKSLAQRGNSSRRCQFNAVPTLPCYRLCQVGPRQVGTVPSYSSRTPRSCFSWHSIQWRAQGTASRRRLWTSSWHDTQSPYEPFLRRSSASLTS